jgi:eukaryotic-like serine/threonine-protein kinase
MRCPRCGLIVALQQGKCARCGYMYNLTASKKQPQSISLSGVVADAGAPGWSLMRGDTVHKGRYQLVEDVTLPKNQQGSAWFAIDTQATRNRVLVHQLDFLSSMPERAPQLLNMMIKRMAPLAKEPGIPPIIDAFQEQGIYYIVQKYPHGKSLSTLMNEQGGSLPEREVADYGRQLCTILTWLAHQPVPLAHGAISTDTIIISNERRVSLAYLPLFPPAKSLQTDAMGASYTAPEQAHGGEPQPAADLYALAAVMHHAVTGFDPRERMFFFYPPARRLNPVVSAGMEAILTRQLRFSVSQRYEKSEDMQKDLEALLLSYPALEKMPALPYSTARLSFPAAQPTSKRTLFSKNNMLVITIISILIACLLIFLIPYISSRSAAINQEDVSATSVAQINQDNSALNAQLALELQSYQQMGIGLSDGRLVFDTFTGRTDVALKKQAATAIQQKNTSAAANFLNQAVNMDPTDGEAQIYNENLHLMQSNAPYVTLVVGLPIDNTALHLGAVREQLEAVYLAQHTTNSKNQLPDGLKLRIIIASSGSNDANVATVAQFIANRVSTAGNLDHLIGVVGWYDSTQTINARDIIASAHLPLIAPTASSVSLSGSSPYLFRISPPDNFQGQILGKLAINTLKARQVLILRDPSDAYSVSLANAFATSAKALGATLANDPFTSNTTTVEQYEQMIIDNEINSPTPATIIFLAGYNVDAIRLSHAIGEIARTNPANASLSKLKVIGGDAVDSGLLLGLGSGDDATIALTYPQDIRRLTFTTFADTNEWSTLKIPQSQWPEFTTDWKSTYQGALGTAAPNPSDKGLMIYDATNLYVHTASLIHGSISGDGIRKALMTLGTGNVAAYQGVSGRILFDASHNPIDKALVLLSVQNGKNGNEIDIQQVLGTFR